MRERGEAAAGAGSAQGCGPGRGAGVGRTQRGRAGGGGREGEAGIRRARGGMEGRRARGGARAGPHLHLRLLLLQLGRHLAQALEHVHGGAMAAGQRALLAAEVALHRVRLLLRLRHRPPRGHQPGAQVVHQLLLGGELEAARGGEGARIRNRGEGGGAPRGGPCTPGAGHARELSQLGDRVRLLGRRLRHPRQQSVPVQSLSLGHEHGQRVLRVGLAHVLVQRHRRAGRLRAGGR